MAYNAVHYFSDAQSAKGLAMSTEQRLQLLDDFRQFHTSAAAVISAASSNQQVVENSVKSKLISMKVPEDLLADFKQGSASKGLRYQTQSKPLMRDYLQEMSDKAGQGDD